MNTVLEIKNLAFSYGAQNVFRDVNLTASEGEVICLMGPNGCGKTTLFDCVMDVGRPERGEIYLMGKLLREYKRHEIAEITAYVPQDHEITFPYTVREMLLMGRTAYMGRFGAPSEEDGEICRKAAEKVGIAGMLDRPYNRLSGGEVKLVLLARALGQEAPIMLMDEPTAHLDYRNELTFLETVAVLCRDEKKTVLMATHNPDHAFYFSSKGLRVRAAMLSRGKITHEGTPDDVITSASILDVYGVRAKIMTGSDENGNMIKRVMLLETA